MKIQAIRLYDYSIPLTTGMVRHGNIIHVIDEEGKAGFGDIAPLPKWSQESLDDCLDQLDKHILTITNLEWTVDNWTTALKALQLLPALSFGLESAILSIIDPILEYHVESSALLMGTPDEILKQAEQRHKDGYRSAKLKVSNLNYREAYKIVNQLKDTFHLRIDVNRAWPTAESLEFFAGFAKGSFDYVEEPFKNTGDLIKFPHPLAVDESFPEVQVDALPQLKALIYKPTLQGGLLNCLELHKKGIPLVLSSAFESDIGLCHVAGIAQRLRITPPVGIGTYHFLTVRSILRLIRQEATGLHFPHLGVAPTTN